MDTHGFRFERIEQRHIDMLHGWLRRPHVHRWWPETKSLDELKAAFLPSYGADDGLMGYIAYLDGRPLGFLQSYAVMDARDGWWESETDPGARGIDQFIAEEQLLGQGIGSRMIRRFLDSLFADPAVTTVQADPRPDNGRAIRCYEKCGFSAVGEVATPDGPALLMRCTRASLAATRQNEA